jgi:hypothetical protein
MSIPRENLQSEAVWMSLGIAAELGIGNTAQYEDAVVSSAIDFEKGLRKPADAFPAGHEVAGREAISVASERFK